MTTKTCWAITDDKRGNQVQAQGLAKAVGFTTKSKVISLKLPWRHIPPSYWPPGVLGVDAKECGLTAPWPDLIISCGRQSVGVAAEIKRRAKDKTIAVHIQHPRVSPSKFDLVAAPAHDNLSGPNVISTLGSLGQVNRHVLDEAAERFAARYTDMPKPLIAVSIGGSNSVYTLNSNQIDEISQQLKKIAVDTGGSLLITASRRTGAENETKLRAALQDIPGEFWNNTGDNPYFAYLGSADYVIVTNDSVNMISEACATGKPVFIIHMPARRKTKFTSFHEAIEENGLAKAFQGELGNWHSEPLNETARVAACIHQIMSNINE